MGEKRLEVSAGTETSYDLVPALADLAAGTAYDYATTPRPH
jgi:hypothetical protein